ncbi:mucin-2 [Streptomyces uncialis]|uniref:mucin-2 n=1 Tax=Streptomyces uncialis TaxID=1048205 RepID=UPI003818B709
MPHFAVDESAHAHRKVVRAGNAAFGLWVRLGSYACDHLTDGVIPGEIAAMYGTAPQLRKLTAVGLIHDSGHPCGRCAQPEPGDYVLHDYLVGNSSRQQVAKAREKAAEKKRRQRSATDSAKNREGIEDDSRSNREHFDDESLPKKSAFPEQSAGQSDVSPGDVQGTRARARPNPPPNPPSPPTEVKGKTASYARESDPQHIGDRPRIPAASRPLVDALTATGLIVGWDLTAGEWLLLEALITRCGIPALTVSARASWQGARQQPRSGRYFLPAWRQLPDAPAGTPGAELTPASTVGTNVLPLAKGRQQQETDDQFDRAMARARARMQQKETS